MEKNLKITYEEYLEILRNDFVGFMTCAFNELNPDTKLLIAPYIELMAARLEDCRHGRIKRLIINIPPRYLKSHMASVSFVAWLLGHKSSLQVICASYGQALADKLATDCRRVMQTDWFQEMFPACRFSSARSADFQTTASGGRMSTSVGGVLTGRGADFIILDDPLKPEEAMSKTFRDAVNSWYTSTLLSRLNNKENGCIIMIMQRLHMDDLVGHAMAMDDWTVVSFPAIAEGDECYEFDTPYGRGSFQRKAGEPLHPERESIKSLRATQKKVGDYTFSSQYQQNPIPEGGAMIKAAWLLQFDELPPSHQIRHRIQSWDTAVKSGEFNDYSVCTSWVVDDQQRAYLVNVVRIRADYPELKRAVITAAESFKPTKILIEDKASGSSLIPDLKRDGVIGIYPCQPLAGHDKEMRLYSVTNVFEAGRVFLPKVAVWLPDYRQELLSFPGSKYDDQVDSTTQALQYIQTVLPANLAIWAKLGKS